MVARPRLLQLRRRVGDGRRRARRQAALVVGDAAPHLRRSSRSAPTGSPTTCSGSGVAPGRARRPLPRELPRVPRGDARLLQDPGRPDQRQPPLRGRRAASTCSTTATRSASSTARSTATSSTAVLPERRPACAGRSSPARPTTRPSTPRRRRDRPSAATGATTTTTSCTPAAPPGLPKGVVWRQGDAFFACLGGGDPMRMQGEVSSPVELPGAHRRRPHLPAAGAADARRRAVDLVHVVLLRRQGRADAGLARPGPGVAHDRGRGRATCSPSSGTPSPSRCSTRGTRCPRTSVPTCQLAVLDLERRRPAVDRLQGAHPRPPSRHVMVNDGFGSSEAGIQGSSRVTAADGPPSGPVRFSTAGAKPTLVLGDDDRAGGARLAASSAASSPAGGCPLGYHGDPEKTAATFLELRR